MSHVGIGVVRSVSFEISAKELRLSPTRPMSTLTPRLTNPKEETGLDHVKCRETAAQRRQFDPGVPYRVMQNKAFSTRQNMGCGHLFGC